MLKLIAKYLVFGIGYGSFWIVVVCIVLEFLAPGALRGLMENFTVHALGSIAVGIGTATTPIVYEFDRLRRWQQITIHATVGLGTFFTVAFSLGWLPMASPFAIAVSVVLGVIIFFAIWYGFYLYGKYEAKKINEKLRNSE